MNPSSLAALRTDFPILGHTMRGQPLVYLDNAATSQKPRAVLEAMDRVYTDFNANVRRGAYELSERATEAYEGVRPKVAQFIGAEDPSEVIYTRGTTESINLVATSWGVPHVKAGDEIVVTRMEHHANFVPWQALAQKTGATFKIVELTDTFEVDREAFARAITPRTKVVALTMLSNVLGTINPVNELITIARTKAHADAIILLDAAQAVVHSPVRLNELKGVDFLAFSAHKICGPTGVGVLWGRRALLEKMGPVQLGGDMILRVGDQETTYNEIPWKFEAGTPNFVGVIGMGAAIDYLTRAGMSSIAEREGLFTRLGLEALSGMKGIRVFGPPSPERRAPIFSFAIEGVHPHDAATFLDHQGIAVRAGHHCAQPLMRTLGVPATLRASFAFYNTEAEVDALVRGIRKTQEYFKT